MCALQSRVQTDIEVQEAEPVVIDPVTHSWMATLPADGMRHHSRVFTDLTAGLFTDGKFARSLYSLFSSADGWPDYENVGVC